MDDLMDSALRPRNPGEPDVIIEFVDVGQGDATVVIDLVERVALVIDCPSWGVGAVRDVLRRFNVGVLEAVFVTHFDEDHFSGIPQIVEDYRPKKIYANPETLLPDDASFPKYRAALASFVDLSERGFSDPSSATRDMSGSMGSVHWQVLAPTTADIWKAETLARPYRNIASQVVAVEVGSFRAILGGDAPARTWTRISDERLPMLRADVFRLSHHGADMRPGRKTVDFQTLMQNIAPSHAVISVGSTNRYAHPGLDSIHVARDSGARVMCTEVSPACLGITDRDARISAVGRPQDLGLPRSCAGNIRVEVSGQRWAVHPDVSAHAAVIEGLATPHCRQLDSPIQRQS